MSKVDERSLSFCIELNSRDQIKRVSLPEGSGDQLMIEGFLGELEEMELMEDIMLEITMWENQKSLDIGEIPTFKSAARLSKVFSSHLLKTGIGPLILFPI